MAKTQSQFSGYAQLRTQTSLFVFFGWLGFDPAMHLGATWWCSFAEYCEVGSSRVFLLAFIPSGIRSQTHTIANYTRFDHQLEAENKEK